MIHVLVVVYMLPVGAHSCFDIGWAGFTPNSGASNRSKASHFKGNQGIKNWRLLLQKGSIFPHDIYANRLEDDIRNF